MPEKPIQFYMTCDGDMKDLPPSVFEQMSQSNLLEKKRVTRFKKQNICNENTIKAQLIQPAMLQFVAK